MDHRSNGMLGVIARNKGRSRWSRQAHGSGPNQLSNSKGGDLAARAPESPLVGSHRSPSQPTQRSMLPVRFSENKAFCLLPVKADRFEVGGLLAAHLDPAASLPPRSAD